MINTASFWFVCVFTRLPASVSKSFQTADKQIRVKVRSQSLRVLLVFAQGSLLSKEFHKDNRSSAKSISKRNKKPWWGCQLSSSHLAFPLLCIFSITENIYGSPACSLPSLLYYKPEALKHCFWWCCALLGTWLSTEFPWTGFVTVCGA